MAYSPTLNPQPVVISDQGAAINIAANATASGVITSAGDAGGYLFQLTGTWVATVVVQITVDGINWVTLTGNGVVINAATGAAVVGGNITANGVYQINAAGCQGVRVATSAYTSGTIVGAAILTHQTPPITAAISVASSMTIAGQAGTAVTWLSGAYLNLTNVVQAIKASAGRLYGWQIFNPNTTPIWVQMFYQAVASVTLGTTAPTMSLGIPAGGTSSLMSDIGMASGTAWTAAATTTRNGSTAPATNVDANFFYV